MYKFAAKIILLLSNLLLLTCRIRVKGRENFTNTIEKSSLLCTFWHNKMALYSNVFSRYLKICKQVAVISQSRDANWLDAFIKVHPNADTIRVAHTKRPQALKTIVESLQKEKITLLITPDGPRGPKYVLKPGPIMAAKKSGCPIVPFTWKSSRKWQLNSWDQFEIPKPFSTIDVIIGEPIYLDESTTVEEDRVRVEALLKASETSF